MGRSVWLYIISFMGGFSKPLLELSHQLIPVQAGIQNDGS